MLQDSQDFPSVSIQFIQWTEANGSLHGAVQTLENNAGTLTSANLTLTGTRNGENVR
jgi:hypothetical protein